MGWRACPSARPGGGHRRVLEAAHSAAAAGAACSDDGPGVSKNCTPPGSRVTRVVRGPPRAHGRRESRRVMAGDGATIAKSYNNDYSVNTAFTTS